MYSITFLKTNSLLLQVDLLPSKVEARTVEVLEKGPTVYGINLDQDDLILMQSSGSTSFRMDIHFLQGSGMVDSVSLT
jgi:hypothetical protein